MNECLGQAFIISPTSLTIIKKRQRQIQMLGEKRLLDGLSYFIHCWWIVRKTIDQKKDKDALVLSASLRSASGRSTFQASDSLGRVLWPSKVHDMYPDGYMNQALKNFFGLPYLRRITSHGLPTAIIDIRLQFPRNHGRNTLLQPHISI